MEKSSKDISEEKTIHQTVNASQSQHTIEQDRKPFNDVIEHFDIVNGSQSPKKLEQIPKRFHKPFKAYVIVVLLLLILTLFFQIFPIFTGK
jgi:quinol-cytochrome oxidoreductase complex cytochrome b subunit